MKLIRRTADKSLDVSKDSSNRASHLLNRIFSQRGIQHADELDFSLKRLHPISSLKNIDKAVQLLVDALAAQQRILIIGDFDADGATATAVAMKALSAMGFKHVNYLVPNRFEFGYGLTPEIVYEAQKYTPDVIITVDNGIASLEGVKVAKELGYQVIITDHHLPGTELPDADAILNPNQPGDEFPSKNLAGVGVIFYFMLALKNALKQAQYFAQQSITEPNLLDLLDLVALGTVADVVPLDQNNRILVEQGLRRMRSGHACAGIEALFRVGKRSSLQAVSTDLGFVCGPRLNAAGRLDDMSLGIECLLSTDLTRAFEMAAALDDLNSERRTIEEDMKLEAMAFLHELDQDNLEEQCPAVICLFKDTWHQGVIGILAARVRERFHRPTIIFAPASDDDKDEIKGSARSISGIHIRDVLDEVASTYPGLLEKFGGHAMAAGLSLRKDQLAEFTQAVCDVVDKHADENTFMEVCQSDGELEADEFDLTHANQLRFAAPWGQHFPPPVFDNQFIILQKTLLKNKHFKLMLKPVDQNKNARNIAAIAFNVEIEKWPDEGAIVHLLYRLEVNEFRGDRSLQLMIEKLL